MDQVKLGIQFHQRLRGPEKEVTAKIKIGEKIVDHLRLRGGVKIDENIAAENQIHALDKKRLGVVLQVQAAEPDQLSALWAPSQFILIENLVMFSLVVISRVTTGAGCMTASPS